MRTLKEIEQPNHEKVVYFEDTKTNLKAIIAIHSTILGPSLGGCRMMNYSDEENALSDVLRLSEGMTYKAAMAGLKLGGGKAVILANPKIDKTDELLESFGYFINQLNVLLHQEIANYKSVFLNDIHYLSSAVGLGSWHDNRLWTTYKYATSFHGLVFLAQNLKKIISAAFGFNKKNLVLDLDNTLWGGVIGDDGLQKIKIGEDGSVGEAFKNFQLELKRLKDSGVLLSIASKNEIEIFT